MAMSLHRLRRALTSLNRLSEVAACYRHCDRPGLVIRSYLQIGKADYPMSVIYRFEDHQLTFSAADWQDLTSIWVVLFGEEYRINGDERVILDLGANIGAFACLAAIRAPHASIYAYEPFPATFEQLRQTLADNELQDRITAKAQAVGGFVGSVSFTADEDIHSHSRHIINRDDESHTAVSLPCVTLGDAIEATGHAEIDLLKMDIEGAEYPTIAHCEPQTLRRCQRIGMEYHGGGDFKAMYQQIRDAGFVCSAHPKKGEFGVIEFTRK